MAATTPLTMVAVGSDPKQKAKDETTKIAAVAATYELRKPGRPITPWHPRAAPKDRERWTEEVQENLRTAAPVIPAYILNGPPTIQQVTTIYKGASQETIAVHFAAAMLEYQMYNTALWDAIEPSLRFEGAYESMDRLQKKEFMNNDLRDGVGLYNYVRELTSVNPITRQIEAMQALTAHGKLPSGAKVTLVHVDQHTNGLLTKWLDVQRPDATPDVLDFRTRLIASMPDEPFSDKIVSIRLHLVDMCNANHDETKTPQGLVRIVAKRARELGLPAGSVLDDVVAPLIKTKKGDEKTKKGDGKDSKPPADEKSNRRPRAGKNDCDFCILDLCRSKEWSKGKDAKKHCLVCSFCDPTKTIPHYPAKGSTGAPTRTELMALTVCQAALRLDPKIDLKKQTIAYCRKLAEDTDGTKKPDEVAAPLVSMEALEMLMDEHGQEVTDPAEFVAWAKSLGIDLCAPLITTLGAVEEAEEVTAEAKEQAAATPGYGWVQDSPVDATPASTGPQVIAKQAAELRQMQEQLDQAQAQLRAQESALRAAQELAPAPPAAPRTREPAEHLRPVQPMTPVVSSALAALHAATPVNSLGRLLAPVPEEPIISMRGEPTSKGNLVLQSVSYTDAFARGVAYQAQAHIEMEKRIVELQKKLKLRTWSWPLAYLLKLPLTVTQAMLAAIKTLQASTTGSAEKTLLWGIILTLAIDKFGVQLTPAIRTILKYAIGWILSMLGVLGRRLVSMSKQGVSTVLAKILATFASMLSAISASMVKQTEASPTLALDTSVQRDPSEAAHVIAQIHEHMLSPLVTVAVPVGNLDGTIDTSLPGVQQFIWIDEGHFGGDAGDTSSAYVHVAPGGFTTVRFREQGTPPQDDVESKHPPDQDQEAQAYDSTEELEAFTTSDNSS